eukprot:TRINITY_DN18831_c0_g1_i1.p2 TRINITY_DN18831_c0_g1~~TRINITY_DN18831_c0_g1_i1.p2  ORF type:complete len:144 (+),score=1.68 TRINITY_DN18831_c0_g1_i1:156-587(+)
MKGCKYHKGQIFRSVIEEESKENTAQQFKKEKKHAQTIYGQYTFLEPQFSRCPMGMQIDLFCNDLLGDYWKMEAIYYKGQVRDFTQYVSRRYHEQTKMNSLATFPKHRKNTLEQRNEIAREDTPKELKTCCRRKNQKMKIQNW